MTGGTDTDLAAAAVATEPARWLLAAGIEGVALTQTHALARSVVREAALRWPGWWDAELFGEPHREADVRVVGSLREGLQRLGLMRRRGRSLRTAPGGGSWSPTRWRCCGCSGTISAAAIHLSRRPPTR